MENAPNPMIIESGRVGLSKKLLAKKAMMKGSTKHFFMPSTLGRAQRSISINQRPL